VLERSFGEAHHLLGRTALQMRFVLAGRPERGARLDELVVDHCQQVFTGGGTLPDVTGQVNQEGRQVGASLQKVLDGGHGPMLLHL
jgi:hypothetical protein